MTCVIGVLPAIILLFILVYFLVTLGKQMSAVKRILIIMGMLLVVGWLIQGLYDPLTLYRNRKALARSQRELNEAEKKWNSQSITDYFFEVEYYSLGALGGCGAIITVRQGGIVEVVETQRGGWEKLPQPRALPETMWDDRYCQYSQFTVPKIFNIVQNGINAGGTVDVSFDPKNGFVIKCDIDSTIRTNAFLRTYISNGVSYEFSNFHRLEPSTP